MLLNEEDVPDEFKRGSRSIFSLRLVTICRYVKEECGILNDLFRLSICF
jgi:hypothetical protein